MINAIDGEGYKPGCSCSQTALEPSVNCYVHGDPDVRQCPYCGQFRGIKACKRCGNTYGIEHLANIEDAIQGFQREYEALVDKWKCEVWCCEDAPRCGEIISND